MPKKTRYKKGPEFYETLSPSMPFTQPIERIAAIPSSPLWIYPAWITGSIVLGILFGLAIKDFQALPDIVVNPGVVAKINDPQYTTATSGLTLSQARSQPIQGSNQSLQADQTSLQNGEIITTFQDGFSSYGQQGSVGGPAASR